MLPPLTPLCHYTKANSDCRLHSVHNNRTQTFKTLSVQSINYLWRLFIMSSLWILENVIVNVFFQHIGQNLILPNISRLNSEKLPGEFRIKRGCVFRIVIWPASRMEQYWVNDHLYHTPQFIIHLWICFCFWKWPFRG